MRFVADEGCDFAVTRALRAAGHDVVAIAEISPRIGDHEVLERAIDERRVLLTEDKDFGELVYARARMNNGVILLRFPADARAAMADAVVDAVGRLGDGLQTSFVVIQPGRVRVS